MRGGGGGGGGVACEQCHQLLLQGGRAPVVCQPAGQGGEARGGASGTMEGVSWWVGGRGWWGEAGARRGRAEAEIKADRWAGQCGHVSTGRSETFQLWQEIPNQLELRLTVSLTVFCFSY